MGFGLQRAASLLACCAAAGLAGACTFPDFVVPLVSAGAPSAGTSPGTSVGGTATPGGSAVAGSNGASGGNPSGGNPGGGSAGSVDPVNLDGPA